MRKTQNKQVEKQTIIAFGSFCLIALATFMFGASWGSRAAEVPFLKLAQVTGTASVSSLEDIIAICRERAKWTCAENAYIDLYEKTKDASVVARLADMQRKLGSPQALQTYAAYTNVGGKDADALYQYAQLLEKSGDIEGALTMYANSAAASGDRLPVRATTGLVRILMQERRFEEALAKIKEFQASAGNAENYFNTELDQLPGLIKTAKRIAAK